MRNNCLFFAIKKFFVEGGYLIIRKSMYGPYPHFIWGRDLKDAEIEHFVPDEPRQSAVKVFFHKLLFRGHVKHTDAYALESTKRKLKNEGKRDGNFNERN